MLDALRRFLSMTTLASWLGAVVFYGAVVVPTAHEVFDSHREIGFVTRRVTGPLNWIGAAAVALLLWSTLSESAYRTRPNRVALWSSWAVMLLSMIALFVLRSVLDGMLDPGSMNVLNRPRFMPLHERYLNVTRVMSLAAIIHLWALISGFGRRPPEARAT
jgi:hypothetical protein